MLHWQIFVPALAQGQALRADDFDMPGFHSQSLAPVPKPSEVNPQYQKQKGLQAWTVVQGVTGLTQRAKQVTRDEHDTEEQHAFVKPAGHAAFERWGGQRVGCRRYGVSR